jgi:hypothetical protein
VRIIAPGTSTPSWAARGNDARAEACSPPRRLRSPLVTSPPALQARLVLADAEEALGRLKRCRQNGGACRLEWVLAVTLLRVVGHVLSGIDAKRGDRAKQVIGGAFARQKDNPIFRDFIKQERDLVLKEYRIGTSAPAYLLNEDGGRLLLDDGSGALLLETPAIERVEEALAWWKEQLTAIEAEILGPAG